MTIILNHFIEIRTLTLKPNTRDQFHRLYIEETFPLLKRWNFDVVAHGPSLHDENIYYVIRRFEGLSPSANNGGCLLRQWRLETGPREAMLALIESYTDIFLELGDGHCAGDALEELMCEGDKVTEGSGCPLWGKLKPQPNQLSIRIL